MTEPEEVWPVSDDDVAGRYTVRSVARALRLIEIVADGPSEGRSLSDLARELGASKSTTLALARTLTSAGMLRDSRPGPRYNLGTALIRLGDITRSQLPLGDICRPVLSQLTELTKMTSRVAIYDNGYPVFIERVDGPGTVRFHTPLGQREEPHASAAGKAMLATMTEEQVRTICAEHGLQARTSRTITDIDRLLASLTTVRGTGFAVDDEEDAEGIFCVGAAFFGHDGRCAGAMSVTGIKSDLPVWKVQELGRTVRRSADQVSELLGGERYKADLISGAIA
ncbi:MAG TPA: IclR family transcriptional regulator [Streptosporangiaceae bacterium]|nr:IclR family transcriptional regulator [Streptosporangiaceae bacterium]